LAIRVSPRRVRDFAPEGARHFLLISVGAAQDDENGPSNHVSQMVDVIISQWVIASALGALCLAFFLFCLLPSLLIARRLRGVKGEIGSLRSDTAELKGALVGDLRGILGEVTDRQIEAAARRQAALSEQITACLREPLNSVAQSLDNFGKAQSSSISQGLESQISMFAEKLDALLGGQVAQAHELQVKTLRSLESTVDAFHVMAKTIEQTAQSATQTMSKQLRAELSKTQAETDANLREAVGRLATQMAGVLNSLQEQSVQINKTAIEQQKRLAGQAQEQVEALASEVRAQSEAIGEAAESMRTTSADVARAVERIIEGMTGLISGAAQEIMRSGKGFTEIFEKSAALSRDLTATASALSGSSKDLGSIVSDYRNVREALGQMIELMRKAAEAARGDTSLAAGVVDRIEAATQKLIVAQNQADRQLSDLNGVLNEAHRAFGAQMRDTVRQVHDHLMRVSTTQQIPQEVMSRHSELDRMISDWVQTTPRLRRRRQAAPAKVEAGEQLVATRPWLPGNVRK
jgi:hypothetical protein